MQALPSPANCCSPCDDQATTQIVGPQGKSAYQVAVDEGFVGTVAQWLASLVGADGLNAYTALTAQFTQPAVGATDVAEVVSSDWAVVGEDAFLEGGGYYEVTAITDSTHVTLKNRGYAANSAPATVIAIGSRLAPSGVKGQDGTNSSGDMLYADNLNAMGDNDTSLANLGGTAVGLGFFKAVSPSAISFPRINADNTVTARAASDFRTDLSLVPGTNVQTYDAFLTSIAALGTAADKMIYTTGVDTAAEAAITSVARTFLAQATAILQRSVLGKVLPRYGLLCEKLSFNVNSAASDNAMTVEASRYRIDRITVDNGSVNLTTATAGVFTAAGGGGTTVAADQALSALTASTKFDDLTLDAGVGTDVLTAATIYARCGTAQGVAATCDLRVWGWRLD